MFPKKLEFRKDMVKFHYISINRNYILPLAWAWGSSPNCNVPVESRRNSLSPMHYAEGSEVCIWWPYKNLCGSSLSLHARKGQKEIKFLLCAPSFRIWFPPSALVTVLPHEFYLHTSDDRRSSLETRPPSLSLKAHSKMESLCSTRVLCTVQGDRSGR